MPTSSDGWIRHFHRFTPGPHQGSEGGADVIEGLVSPESSTGAEAFAATAL
jgi:hypothetical protein